MTDLSQFVLFAICGFALIWIVKHKVLNRDTHCMFMNFEIRLPLVNDHFISANILESSLNNCALLWI